MNNNLNRHKLLKILSEQYIKANQGNGPLGVSWDELQSRMNCTLDKLMEISAPLYEAEEVARHGAHGVNGVYAKMKGVSSYTTKKYKRENNKLIFDLLKNWVQILIPLISLFVTLYVVISSERRMNKKSEEINRLENRLKEMERNIFEIGRKFETLNDSTNFHKLNK